MGFESGHKPDILDLRRAFIPQNASRGQWEHDTSHRRCSAASQVLNQFAVPPLFPTFDVGRSMFNVRCSGPVHWISAVPYKAANRVKSGQTHDPIPEFAGHNRVRNGSNRVKTGQNRVTGFFSDSFFLISILNPRKSSSTAPQSNCSWLIR